MSEMTDSERKMIDEEELLHGEIRQSCIECGIARRVRKLRDKVRNGSSMVFRASQRGCEAARASMANSAIVLFIKDIPPTLRFGYHTFRSVVSFREPGIFFAENVYAVQMSEWCRG